MLSFSSVLLVLTTLDHVFCKVEGLHCANLTTSIFPCESSSYQLHRSAVIPSRQRSGILDYRVGSGQGPECSNPCAVTAQACDRYLPKLKPGGVYPNLEADVVRNCFSGACANSVAIDIVWTCNPYSPDY